MKRNSGRPSPCCAVPLTKIAPRAKALFMSLIVLLDAGPLGMITNPKSSAENEACKNWLAGLAYNGVDMVIPEIADYEVRREWPGKDRR